MLKGVINKKSLESRDKNNKKVDVIFVILHPPFGGLPLSKEKSYIAAHLIPLWGTEGGQKRFPPSHSPQGEREGELSHSD